MDTFCNRRNVRGRPSHVHIICKYIFESLIDLCSRSYVLTAMPTTILRVRSLFQAPVIRKYYNGLCPSFTLGDAFQFECIRSLDPWSKSTFHASGHLSSDQYQRGAWPPLSRVLHGTIQIQAQVSVFASLPPNGLEVICTHLDLIEGSYRSSGSDDGLPTVPSDSNAHFLDLITVMKGASGN